MKTIQRSVQFVWDVFLVTLGFIFGGWLIRWKEKPGTPEWDAKMVELRAEFKATR